MHAATRKIAAQKSPQMNLLVGLCASQKSTVVVGGVFTVRLVLVARNQLPAPGNVAVNLRLCTDIGV